MFWGDTYSKALESTLVEPNSMRTQPIPYESHQTRKNLNGCPASHARPSQAPTLKPALGGAAQGLGRSPLKAMNLPASDREGNYLRDLLPVHVLR